MAVGPYFGKRAFLPHERVILRNRAVGIDPHHLAEMRVEVLRLATELLFAMALATFCRSLGAPVSLGAVLLVNISVGLLAGLIPVPGGIGVTEGGLTFGLIQAGVPEQVAFPAVLLHRISSFYLPPIWGFFAMRWLERNEHV